MCPPGLASRQEYPNSPPLSASFLSFLFQLCWVFDAAHRLFLVVTSEGCSLAVCGLLIAVASLFEELMNFSCHRSQSLGSVAVGTQALLLHCMWDLPGPKVEPVFDY